MLAFEGAKNSNAGNSEVLAVRQQVSQLTASSSAGQLPADVAKATTDISTKLATFGGVVAGRGAVAEAVEDAVAAAHPTRTRSCRSMR